MSSELVGMTAFFATTIIFLSITFVCLSKLSRTRRELNQLKEKLSQYSHYCPEKLGRKVQKE